MAYYTLKNWKNRDVEFPGRRTLTDTVSGTSQTVDVTRSEGTVTEAGDAFDASTMNDLEGRIGSAFTLVEADKLKKPANTPSEGNVVKYLSGSIVWAPESGGGGGGDFINYLPKDTASGSVASFPDGAEEVPVVSCISDIVAQQEGSGDPSPSNPRPITGYTGLTITNVDDTVTPTETETYPIDWTDEAGTVYGGTLNVTTGVLTVTYKEFDMGDATWTKYTSYNYPFYAANLSSEGIKTATAGDILIKCEIYKAIGALTLGGSSGFGNNAHNLEICQQSSGTQILVQDSDYSTAPDFTDAVRGKKIIFELATPTVIQLDPTEIKTFLGDNNISSDTGDVSVNYRADIGLYIDKKIAAI